LAELRAGALGLPLHGDGVSPGRPSEGEGYHTDTSTNGKGSHTDTPLNDEGYPTDTSIGEGVSQRYPRGIPGAHVLLNTQEEKEEDGTRERDHEDFNTFYNMWGTKRGEIILNPTDRATTDKLLASELAIHNGVDPEILRAASKAALNTVRSKAAKSAGKGRRLRHALVLPASAGLRDQSPSHRRCEAGSRSAR
jgi:hypothetical protein